MDFFYRYARDVFCKIVSVCDVYLLILILRGVVEYVCKDICCLSHIHTESLTIHFLTHKFSLSNNIKTQKQRLRLTKKADRLVIVLVGLPGRGKSFIARKLQNFLTWRGSECKVFNVGKYRRLAADGACGADFFDSKNEKAAELRQKAAR